MPTAPTGPQSGAPGVSRAPVKPPDLQSVGQATKALQGVGKGAARGLRGKLLGTTLSKVIAGALAVVVAGAAATGAYAIFRPKPQPVLQVQSAYHVGATPAGAVATTLHISGQAFASTSAITILLDGRPAPGARQGHSDGQGNLRADLTITAAWPLGTHTLTARDAQGNATAQGGKIAVVAQGAAHTPGPSGAPSDDASFTITTDFLSGPYTNINNTAHPHTATPPMILIVTGHLGSTATVCGPFDNGQPHRRQVILDDPFTGAVESVDIVVTACMGSYQGGRLSYTETILSYTETAPSDPTFVCRDTYTPQLTYHLEGTFTGSATISGTLITNQVIEFRPCPGLPSFEQKSTVPAHSQQWTGTITSGP